MNERAEFLQHFMSVFAKMIDRLESMTETEVLDGLLQVDAARNIYKEEFSERVEGIQAEPRQRHRLAGVAHNTPEEFAYLSSIQAFVNSAHKLEARVGGRPYRVGAGSGFFNSLERALNARLEWLRRRPGSDSGHLISAALAEVSFAGEPPITCCRSTH